MSKKDLAVWLEDIRRFGPSRQDTHVQKKLARPQLSQTKGVTTV